MHLNTHKTALVLGLFISAFHLAWSILIVLGWAQPLVDWVLWAHMIHMQYVVGPFDITAALSLLIYTFAAGYVLGWVFAWMWNRLHR